MKQEKIAERLDISQGHVSQIINGRRSVTKGVAIRLSKEFGREPGWWMFASADEIKSILGNGGAQASRRQ